MAAANVISVIGTVVSVLGLITGNIPEGPDKAKVQYIIANDDPNGTGLSNAGGDMPDVRMWDETAEFLGADYDPGNCPEGYTTCTSEVNTQEAVTYTLFSGNNDAICIAWAGLSWAGGQKKYGFHPGNWAHGCDAAGYHGDKQRGNWFYANQKVPGISNEDEVFCGWVDKDGDLETTGFQVHWPEFDDDENRARDLNYYCTNNVAVNFRTEYDPNGIIHYTRKRNMFADHPSVAMSSPVEDSPSSAASATKRQAKRVNKQFEKRIIKSTYPKHQATELCDRNMSAAGPSFVSYEQKQFCYMPTKTLYPFCDTIDNGACWDDHLNIVTIKGAPARLAEPLPDLSAVIDIVNWGNKEAPTSRNAIQ